jgi:hypothetical protein
MRSSGLREVAMEFLISGDPHPLVASLALSLRSTNTDEQNSPLNIDAINWLEYFRLLGRGRQFRPER